MRAAGDYVGKATLSRKMDLSVTARLARADDLDVLVHLYRELEAEMVAIHPMWSRADGLVEPVEQSLLKLIAEVDARVYLGEIDGYPLGFMYGRSEHILAHEEGTRVAAIRLVFVEEAARGVGVGEIMRDTLMEEFRSLGHDLFDAHVLPGHRLTKNFFEAGGFSARSIVMHHNDAPGGGRRISRSYRALQQS